MGQYCYMDEPHHANLAYGEKAWRQLHKNTASRIEQILEATPYKTAVVCSFTTHHEKYPS